jgi:hypothetical protein
LAVGNADQKTNALELKIETEVLLQWMMASRPEEADIFHIAAAIVTGGVATTIADGVLGIVIGGFE